MLAVAVWERLAMPLARFGQFPFTPRVALLQAHALQQAVRGHGGFVNQRAQPG